MSKWKNIALGEVLTLQRGFDITKNEQSEGTVPIVSSSGISSYHNKFKVTGPGVVTGRKGTLGKVHYISENYWPHDTTLWIKDYKGNFPRFIYYYLSIMRLENYDVGASNPTLNRNHIHKLKILWPLPHIQRKIAAILSAYDELIENNNRRIAILEKMAEEIYREWFVRLRFPGHEHTKIVKGVPEGWEITSMGSIAKFLMGQSPPSEEYNDKGIGLPFNQGVGTYGSRFPKKEVYCATKGRIAHKGEILFSVRAPVGRLNIADCEMIIGRGLCAIHHHKNLQHYMWYLLKNVFSNEDIIGNGAIYLSVGKDELLNFKIMQPNENLADLFNQKVKPIDNLISSLINKNNILKSTRDRLLPRLISGKLDVEHLDIAFPSGMAEESRQQVNEKT